MNSPERLPTETHKPFTGYLWGALAVLTCPCHLPILAMALAGHADERMWQHYLDGHEERKPVKVSFR